MSVRYPVAPTAEAALARPLGRAEREREARAAAGDGVAFVTEPMGPAFATREAALDAYAGRLDDERPGRAVRLAPDDAWCALAETAAGPRAGLKPVTPSFADGRRWPEPPPRAATAWRLSVSYWKVGVEEIPTLEQARRARRTTEGEVLDARALRALTRQPLQPVRPQQPLDVGLFEQRLPEHPDRVIPDE